MLRKKYYAFLFALVVSGILTACSEKQDIEKNVTEIIENISDESNDTTDVSDSSSTTEKSKADEMREMFGDNCIGEQTFSVELSEYAGEVYFVPYAPSAENPEFSIEIIQNGEVLTTINAYVPESLAGESFSRLDAVSFYDVNYDNCTDIVLIQTYGDTTFTAIYYGFAPDAYDYERYFSVQNQLSDTITSQVANLTIPEIRNFLSDGKKNGTFTSYQEAYTYVSKLSELEGTRDLAYNLIYFDEDDIPELVTGKESYYVNLYTYHDGTVYKPMNHWGYGAGGNAGYEYSPYKNSLRNSNTDYAGAILYTTYAAMNKQYLIETVADIKLVNFDDVNENGMPDPEEEGSIGYYGVLYLNGEEATSEECDAYDIGGYEYIRPIMSLDELNTALGY